MLQAKEEDMVYQLLKMKYFKNRSFIQCKKDKGFLRKKKKKKEKTKGRLSFGKGLSILEIFCIGAVKQM